MKTSRSLRVILALIIFWVCVPAHAQELRSYKFIATMSKSYINTTGLRIFGKTFKRTSQDLRLYRLTYSTKDQNGKDAVVSGLLAVPASGAPRGLLVWNHGTITSNKFAPSNFKTKAGLASNEYVLLAFSSGGYAVAMPDYLGYGTHKGAHPYPMGRINARSALDIIAPSRKLATKLKRSIGKDLWVSGYSQGGAVAMWTARLLQENKTPAKRAAALSGPYDLTGVTRLSLLAKPASDRQLIGQMFLAGLMGHGFLKNSNELYSTLFKPAMALAVRSAFSTEKPDDDRVKDFTIAAKFLKAKSLKDVLNAQFASKLEEVDTSHPLIKQMRESDCLEWTPSAPLLLWALESDGIVTAANTQKALASFRARGAGGNMVRAVMKRDPSSDHLKAYIPALIATRQFFDGGFAAVPGIR